MGHHTAHFHDQSAGRHEQGCPGWVCPGADKNLTRGYPGAVRVEHHPHRTLDHARRDRAAGDSITAVGSCVDAFVECASITDQQARHLSAAPFALVTLAPTGD